MMNLIYTYQPLFDYFLLAVGFAYSQQMVLRAGVFSIGSAGFASIGAYGVAILVKNQGVHPLIALLLATIAGCVGGDHSGRVLQRTHRQPQRTLRPAESEFAMAADAGSPNIESRPDDGRTAWAGMGRLS